MEEVAILLGTVLMFLFPVIVFTYVVYKSFKDFNLN